MVSGISFGGGGRGGGVSPRPLTLGLWALLLLCLCWELPVLVSGLTGVWGGFGFVVDCRSASKASVKVDNQICKCQLKIWLVLCFSYR